MFVTQQRGQARMGLANTLADADSTQRNPHWQRIDKHPQSTLGTAATLHTPQ
ncbi:hypothetical protein PSCICN_09300 [Pseudomonas cichorii]|nr:hypothetical protein PSCICN_09300 [Pseudomonas cichorii]